MDVQKKQVFVDGIESISMIEGTIRLELFTYLAGSDNRNRQVPDHETTCELITSMNGLLRIQEVINRIVIDLKKRNVGLDAADTAPVQSENFPIGEGKIGS